MRNWEGEQDKRWDYLLIFNLMFYFYNLFVCIIYGGSCLGNVFFITMNKNKSFFQKSSPSLFEHCFIDNAQNAALEISPSLATRTTTYQRNDRVPKSHVPDNGDK